MALPLPSGLTPSEVAFLCEMELVTVVPRQRLDSIDLLSVSASLSRLYKLDADLTCYTGNDADSPAAAQKQLTFMACDTVEEATAREYCPSSLAPSRFVTRYCSPRDKDRS